jgi:manganese oxidase
LTKAVKSVAPDSMAMGTGGMADMASMHMPLPHNTLPMMTGSGQFGPIEMGGMFSVMKIREELAANDYRDPGPYKNPSGTVAHEISDSNRKPLQLPDSNTSPMMDMPGGMDMPEMKHRDQGHQ